MSVTSTLGNALSGLTAASKAASVVSSNIANATTEGYGVRQVQTTSVSLNGQGSGVQVVSVSRNVNEGVLADRRAADAAYAQAATLASFYGSVEGAIGLPGDEGSLSSEFSQFEAALVEAGSRPDSDARLANVVRAAESLAGTLNDLSADIQSERLEAEKEIARQVDNLNTSLAQIQDLNGDIRLQIAAGNDPLGLMDQRQVLIDQIATIVPVSVVDRDFGQVALITESGGVLLDGTAAEISFRDVGLITPDMTVASGGLYQVEINGSPVDSTSPNNPLKGGSLDALFEIRDELAVSAQGDVDAVARDLIERFQNSAIDPTLSAGEPGLFTDAGALVDPANEVGLAGRIELNARVDPAKGGEVWRVRTGLGATSPGDPGAGGIILALSDALSEPKVVASGSFSSIPRTAAALASDLLSTIGAARQASENEVSYTAAKWETLRSLELEGGVDTDAELQKLLMIETAYAANARVIQTVDEMLDLLLRI
ncbi:flagellar hook-associated protein FlgK [Dinoroseobacter shibae DFL 12 = DSM 16493]|jgi:flagellar hook-associated protein 1 FlgK|uniref:Flagellar hook-associated protein 1 n=1 Tax=Dinoroseobacter shibae (strain DSM 16493 / NCIMB 14021 / DFL 12) TaxID=398580 RepID=A8LNL7_DINSH|nr:flagellar hook-associated protein FlgK [Dinoroseobacter shibae]ABV95111.1 flagellar hook-associated protein FlgK [Dinoroseobacter shibae DFL 12 = DSM 16493]URF46526.1 flagellar hook-associated protein FlgK [Dinoroseobacter shibae]URF50832.1 flagellar hook-associated protein FlgK [Dinoroseobacter shibae]